MIAASPQSDKLRLFISYSRRNVAEANRLFAALEKREF
jgi:hypothetical protein